MERSTIFAGKPSISIRAIYTMAMLVITRGYIIIYRISHCIPLYIYIHLSHYIYIYIYHIFQCFFGSNVTADSAKCRISAPTGLTAWITSWSATFTCVPNVWKSQESYKRQQGEKPWTNTLMGVYVSFYWHIWSYMYRQILV